MKVTILGSGTIIPDPNRNPAGYLLQHNQKHLLLDLGPGTLPRLQQEGVTPPELDGILLSHFHFDHVGDLQHLLFGLRIPGNDRSKPLVIHGPVGLKALLEGYESLWGRWVQPRGYELQLHEWKAGESFSVGELNVSVFEAAHGGEKQHCLSYRITSPDERVFAYSGDSEFSESLIACCKGADVAILDCACPQGRPTEGHMTPGECGEIAARAGIHTSILTHFYPQCFRHEGEGVLQPERDELKQQCKEFFAANAGREPLLAWDGLKVELDR